MSFVPSSQPVSSSSLIPSNSYYPPSLILNSRLSRRITFRFSSPNNVALNNSNHSNNIINSINNFLNELGPNRGVLSKFPDFSDSEYNYNFLVNKSKEIILHYDPTNPVNNYNFRFYLDFGLITPETFELIRDRDVIDVELTENKKIGNKRKPDEIITHTGVNTNNIQSTDMDIVENKTISTEELNRNNIKPRSSLNKRQKEEEVSISISAITPDSSSPNVSSDTGNNKTKKSAHQTEQKAQIPEKSNTKPPVSAQSESLPQSKDIEMEMSVKGKQGNNNETSTSQVKIAMSPSKVKSLIHGHSASNNNNKANESIASNDKSSTEAPVQLNKSKSNDKLLPSSKQSASLSETSNSKPIASSNATAANPQKSPSLAASQPTNKTSTNSTAPTTISNNHTSKTNKPNGTTKAQNTELGSSTNTKSNSDKTNAKKVSKSVEKTESKTNSTPDIESITTSSSSDDDDESGEESESSSSDESSSSSVNIAIEPVPVIKKPGFAGLKPKLQPKSSVVKTVTEVQAVSTNNGKAKSIKTENSSKPTETQSQTLKKKTNVKQQSEEKTQLKSSQNAASTKTITTNKVPSKTQNKSEKAKKNSNSKSDATVSLEPLNVSGDETDTDPIENDLPQFSCANCGKKAELGPCPPCQRVNRSSYFCEQKCYERNWSEHEQFHDPADRKTDADDNASVDMIED